MLQWIIAIFVLSLCDDVCGQNFKLFFILLRNLFDLRPLEIFKPCWQYAAENTSHFELIYLFITIEPDLLHGNF